ncbi:nucleoside-diphosphate kinase [bacterium]|nr:nucleoside-diphosphate kinase [bacterium]PIV81105.1 MAG: nucleoside-diphosphate kinase [bacterium CG17_big_fil_post_rev_8_21_14_2_50_64_8]PJA75616.1 MAG: nucleoside-diphosphate kinase [bacterium CG_4_9_14_3_um_filter_65_15]
MQQTYFMIKPEIVAAKEQKIGDILAIVNRAGFRITRLAMRTMPRELVEDFYGEHRGKPFYGELVEYIAGGPVVTVRLEREGAVAALRELIGATNPQDAAIGTIRDLFGASLQNNAVHASANPEDAARELALIFG